MKTITLLITIIVLSTSSIFGQFGNSLYSDVKGYKVGDILSIIIVETADATRETKSSSSSQAGASANASVSGDVSGLLPSSFGLSTGYDDSYKGSEGTEQRERLTGRISAKIIEKTESGNFKIEGNSITEVNGEENVMTLTGLVRPRDIMSNNTVYSYNIADRKISSNKGNFVDKIAPQGTFPKVITGILGAAIVAVAAGLLVL